MPKISLRRRKSKKSDNQNKATKKSIKTKIFSLKSLIGLMVIVALAGFVYSGQYYYKNTFSNDERVFYDMINKSLNTESVLRTVTQESQSRSDKQTILLSFTPNVVSDTKSSISQIATNRQASEVATETIGTKTEDFIRYTKIDIPTSGKTVDYSNILNIWAKKDAASTGSDPQILNEVAFMFIPFGNFNDADRAKLMSMIKEKQVYHLERESVNYQQGRPILSVNADIKPRALVEVIREYAKITGIGNLDQLDPSQYSNSYVFTLKLKIDMISRHLLQMNYPNDERIESYESYGLRTRVNVPRDDQTISAEELQSRLQ